MAGSAGQGAGRRRRGRPQELIAPAALALLACALGAPAFGGEAVAPEKPAAPAPGTVKLRASSVGRLTFVTPREARQDFPRVTVTDGKASLPVQGLEAIVRGSAVAVVPNGGKTETAPATTIPQQGFGAALAVTVPGAAGATHQAALAFAATGKPGEVFVRNLAVVGGQYGDHNIVIVDDNCNGRYNDAGEDAVMVDGGPLAVPLGAALMVGNGLYNLQVVEDGSSLVLTPVKDCKMGAAMVSRNEGSRQVIGAVLKGPAGSYHAIGDREPAMLPAGSHTLAFVSLGNPAANRFAILEGTASFTVPEDGKLAVLEFGRPEIQVTATPDPKSGDVKIDPPGLDSVTCRIGKFKFFFEPGIPKVDVVRLGTQNERKQVRDLSMPQDSRTRAPLALVVDRSKYDLDRGRRYRFEVSWPLGVMDDARGSATVEIPVPPPPPPKPQGGKK